MTKFHLDPHHKTGVLLNPDSGRVKKQMVRSRALLAGMPCSVCKEASTLEGIQEAVHSFIQNKIDLLVIIGGDGTVQAVLNRYLSGNQESEIPRFLIVPGGTTNMTAQDLGLDGNHLKILERAAQLLDGTRDGKIVRRKVLKISRDGIEAIYGMFFGAGIIADGARYFQDHIRGSGITGETASLLVVINFIFKLLAGRSSPYLSPVQVMLQDPRKTPEKLTCMLLFASTLDRLLFGLRPYWGKEQNPIHFTWIRNDPDKFWRSIFAIIFNRGGKLKKENGYFSSNDIQLNLSFNGDFIVDGEIFRADNINGGTVTISTTGPLDFIVPDYDHPVKY